MEISEGVISLGLRPRRITPSSTSIILHKILSLIQKLLNNLCSQVKHGPYKICNGLGLLRPYLKLFESGVSQTILNATDKCSHFILVIVDMACFFDLILVRMRKGRQAFISRILDNKPRACFTRNRSNSG